MKFAMFVLSLAAIAFVGAPALAAAPVTPPVAITQTTFDYGRFGHVAVYQPVGTASSVVLLLSGKAGWNSILGGVARRLADEGALVAGIDTPRLYKTLEASGESCVYPAGDFEMLAHSLEAQYRLPHYRYPVVVGVDAGAALTYALLLQAPAGTFAGAISAGFCPRLTLSKSLCPGNLLQADTAVTARGNELAPVALVPSPWRVLPHDTDRDCSAMAAPEFLRGIAGATFVDPVVGKQPPSAEADLPVRISSALAQLQSDLRKSEALPPPTSLADLPVIEVPASGGNSDRLAILLTGDGGWSGLDREVAAALAARGVPVAGLSTLQYFWIPKTPAQVGADLDRLVRYYLDHWHKSAVTVIGYSMGADVLPFAVNRMSAATRAHVTAAAAIAPGITAQFEFHLTNWLGSDHDGLPIAPEVTLLRVPFTCIYADGDREGICPDLDTKRYRVVKLSGGHHFNGDYARLAQELLVDTPLR